MLYAVHRVCKRKLCCLQRKANIYIKVKWGKEQEKVFIICSIRPTHIAQALFFIDPAAFTLNFQKVGNEEKKHRMKPSATNNSNNIF